MRKNQLSPEQAFNAMFVFLDQYYERTGRSPELGALLGELQLNRDGRPFDPAANVAGGVHYLRELVNRFGHKPELVLAAYNAGEQAVESYGGVPPYRETVAYVGRILRWWQPSPIEPVAGSEARASSVSSKLEARD